MLFSYHWLQSFFDKKLPEPKELACLIIKHGFEVEKVEKNSKDTIFDISILSNRPDCFSHIGMAREIGAILKLKINLPKIKTVKTKNSLSLKSFIDVIVEAPEACLRYTAKGVSGVKIGPSPKWIQERLIACGLRPINNIVDATNYVMLEMGQPLHAFDWDKLQKVSLKSKSKKIIVRFASKGETIDALGDKKYEFAQNMLVISDEAGPLAIAGIKGGKHAEISSDTKIVIIESANFDAKTIRSTSRRLGLQTDASRLYEHGLDRGGTMAAAERVADLIAQISSGVIMAGSIDRNPRPVKPKKVLMNVAKIESVLGMDIQSAQVKKNLELLGFSVKKGAGLNLEVEVPSRRTDIGIAEDLIEEVGRIAGYDLIMPKLPVASVLPAVRNYEWLWKNAAKDALMAVGYSETRNYSFISQNDALIYGFDEKKLLEIKNPVNADLRFLRPSLLINVIKNIEVNAEKESVLQFEIGKIFAIDKRREPVMLAGMGKGQTLFYVKGSLEYLFGALGIDSFQVLPFGEDSDEAGHSLLDPARRAKLSANKKEVGFLGYLAPDIAEKLGMKPPVIFEIDFDLVSKMATQRKEYRQLSIYPEAVRDLSVDVPVRTPASHILEVMRASDQSKLIRNIEIGGQPYISGKTKNILFKFNLHSDKRTLDSNEINDWQKATIAAIEKNPEWKVKK